MKVAEAVCLSLVHRIKVAGGIQVELHRIVKDNAELMHVNYTIALQNDPIQRSKVRLCQDPKFGHSFG